MSLAQDKGINNACYRFVFKNTQSILTSRFLYDDIKKYVAEDAVHYCPNGVTSIPINDFKKEKESNGSQLLFLSNIIKNKGVNVLLEACGELMKRGLKFECHFIGDWGDISEIEFLSKVDELGISNSVIVHGRKVGREKFELLEESDIFVLPTLNDCFPLVVLEAMQFSLPVVASREGGIPEMVDDNENGFLVSKGDVFELVEKLEILIKEPNRAKEMGKKGRRSFEKSFRLKSFEKRFTQILSQAISIHHQNIN